MHNCTVGSHLLAQNLSKSSNLDSRHEQFSFLLPLGIYLFYFLLCFVGVFLCRFVCGFGGVGGSGFGVVFKKGGLISVWIKRQKQSSVCKRDAQKCFVARGRGLCMHCGCLSEFAVSVEKGAEEWLRLPSLCCACSLCLSHHCSTPCCEGGAYSKEHFCYTTAASGF